MPACQSDYQTKHKLSCKRICVVCGAGVLLLTTELWLSDVKCKCLKLFFTDLHFCCNRRTGQDLRSKIWSVCCQDVSQLLNMMMNVNRLIRTEAKQNSSVRHELRERIFGLRRLRDINWETSTDSVQAPGSCQWLERRLDVVTAPERGNVLGGDRRGCTIVLSGRTLAMVTGFLCGPERSRPAWADTDHLSPDKPSNLSSYRLQCSHCSSQSRGRPVTSRSMMNETLLRLAHISWLGSRQLNRKIRIIQCSWMSLLTDYCIMRMSTKANKIILYLARYAYSIHLISCFWSHDSDHFLVYPYMLEPFTSYITASELPDTF